MCTVNPQNEGSISLNVVDSHITSQLYTQIVTYPDHANKSQLIA